MFFLGALSTAALDFLNVSRKKCLSFDEIVYYLMDRS